MHRAEQRCRTGCGKSPFSRLWRVDDVRHPPLGAAMHRRSVLRQLRLMLSAIVLLAVLVDASGASTQGSAGSLGSHPSDLHKLGSYPGYYEDTVEASL